MNFSKSKTIYTLSLAAAFALQGSAFAYGPGPHPGPMPHPGPGPCYGCGPAAGDGFLAGLEAALATSYSILTTDANENYDSETLLIEAANYEDTGVKGPVFSAFSQQMVAQMGQQIGANQVAQANQDQLDSMIADRILQDAQ
jgi:hypothetical protein